MMDSNKIEPQMLIDYIKRRCPELKGDSTGSKMYQAYYLVVELCTRYATLRDAPLSSYLDT